MNKCYGGFMSYEFDVDGHTVIKCKGGDGKKSRKLCPHYGGKCPAIQEGEKNG